MPSSRRLKLAHVLVVLLASGLALLAWTQTWVNAVVAQSGTARQSLEVTGATASPALTALAMAGLALAGALTIAGPVIRFVLGLLEVLLGLSVFLAALTAVTGPAAASAGAITKATGVSGRESVLDGVVSAVATPWPYLALLAGVVMAAVGVSVLVTARRWPGPTTRYQAVRFAPADSTGGTDAAAAGVDTGHDAVDDWDGLSRGEDPTAQR
ncbi:peptidase [Cryobacterium sp. TMT1-21]|uniref:Peptidase n=1 Tax=Cryobacterium shii TaxID=1259235 RepID=A0AAQ2C856_9MICO|nr:MULTISPECIES: Trp biosynthesis-associated membrane protein [Cryobacterium]TFC51628.1 peptidase [Cryobacterium shii]TFC83623.1 peptidase [Cryobacterium sp. TmT2-59]TFD13596.1 peptidase [Cryobacterium sp. TMT4-10]TFD16042.1 peptidase [Cryobacterium sp. TMT1-21]TFD27132.1 peptidase [Cryobacterium sp. TMT2-23]